MRLLDLPGGGLSLEFASFEAPAVGAALAELGMGDVADMGSHQLLRIGAGEIAYLGGWAAPCLIARDAASTALLHRIADRVAAGD